MPVRAKSTGDTEFLPVCHLPAWRAACPGGNGMQEVRARLPPQVPDETVPSGTVPSPIHRVSKNASTGTADPAGGRGQPPAGAAHPESARLRLGNDTGGGHPASSASAETDKERISEGTNCLPCGTRLGRRCVCRAGPPGFWLPLIGASSHCRPPDTPEN